MVTSTRTLPPRGGETPAALALETGEDLIRLRKRFRLDQYALAPLCGMSPIHLSRLERGQSRLTPLKRLRILNALTAYAQGLPAEAEELLALLEAPREQALALIQAEREGTDANPG